MSWNKFKETGALDNPDNPSTDDWVGDIDTDFIDTKIEEYERSKKDGSKSADGVGEDYSSRLDSYTDEELKQIWDDDFGEVNEKVIDYDDPEYIASGKIKPKWGNDAVDGPEVITLPEGTRVVQYAHPGTSGTYFAPENTKYDDLQLPDSEDKRQPTVYEVQKGGLPVEKSEVATQPWNKTETSPKGTGAMQYKTIENADMLVAQGKLKPIDKSNE